MIAKIKVPISVQEFKKKIKCIENKDKIRILAECYQVNFEKLNLDVIFKLIYLFK